MASTADALISPPVRGIGPAGTRAAGDAGAPAASTAAAVEGSAAAGGRIPGLDISTAPGARNDSHAIRGTPTPAPDRLRPLGGAAGAIRKPGGPPVPVPGPRSVPLPAPAEPRGPPLLPPEPPPRPPRNALPPPEGPLEDLRPPEDPPDEPRPPPETEDEPVPPPSLDPAPFSVPVPPVGAPPAFASPGLPAEPPAPARGLLAERSLRARDPPWSKAQDLPLVPSESARRPAPDPGAGVLPLWPPPAEEPAGERSSPLPESRCGGDSDAPTSARPSSPCSGQPSPELAAGRTVAAERC
jgi:hypothetical protein